MPKKILVIDDEPDVVEFQKAYLTRRKYEVFAASTAAEALEAVRTHAPDVVFCDLRLPGDVSGMEILEQVMQAAPQTRFFLVTGLMDGDIEEKAAHLGAREVLMKPVSNDTIIRKIEEQ